MGGERGGEAPVVYCPLLLLLAALCGPPLVWCRHNDSGASDVQSGGANNRDGLIFFPHSIPPSTCPSLLPLSPLFCPLVTLTTTRLAPPSSPIPPDLPRLPTPTIPSHSHALPPVSSFPLSHLLLVSLSLLPLSLPSGKTALAATIAMNSDFPFIKMVRDKELGG